MKPLVTKKKIKKEMLQHVITFLTFKTLEVDNLRHVTMGDKIPEFYFVCFQSNNPYKWCSYQYSTTCKSEYSSSDPQH